MENKQSHEQNHDEQNNNGSESGQFDLTARPATGRPTLCTPELTQEISMYIATGGLSYKDAATLSGINEGTFYNWMKRGREAHAYAGGDSTNVPISELPFYEFFESIQKAIPQRKATLVAKVRRAADESWQAAAWLLERLHPEEFARRSRVDVVNWKVEVIELIKQGLEFEIVERELGREDAERLFIAAGETVPTT